MSMIIRRILTALLALTVLAGGLSMTTAALAEEMTEEDITAKFENGVLSLTLAKKDAPKIPEKKTIMING